MVEFNQGYNTPMDREYDDDSIESRSDELNVDTGDIGMSVPMGISAGNVQGVAAKMRTGTSSMELQFMGTGKGGGQGPQTPGMYGELQREALEELSRVNKVDFTTHASSGIMGLAGRDQQGNFSKKQKEQALNEIRRGIDFASDVAKGGNVVMHTGEFQRPVSELDRFSSEAEKSNFQSYGEESEEATFRVVDKETGEVKGGARKNQKIPIPEWNTADPGEEYYDPDEGVWKTAGEDETIYVNYDGEKVDRKNRVPKYDKEKDDFVVKEKGWEDFKNMSEEMTEEARMKWKNDEIDEDSVYARFKEEDIDSEEDIKIRPEEAMIMTMQERQAAEAEGQSLLAEDNFSEIQDRIERLREAKEAYEEIEEGVGDEEEWRLKRKVEDLAGGLVEGEDKKPTEIIDQQLNDLKKRRERLQKRSASNKRQAMNIRQDMKNLVSEEEYALKESYDSYAKLGIHAMEKSEELEEKGELDKPLFVAMENIFPDSYGGHPDELKDLVEGGREKMKEYLQRQKGMDKQRAEQEAKEHIKAHLDTAHLNLWRKYWKGDPDASPEENDEQFNEWMTEKVEKLAEEDLIGSVHLSDNYGYNDEHLAPGQGNTPNKQLVEKLREKGFDEDLIVEPGADATTDRSDFHGLMKTWRLFGSSVYGSGGMSGRGGTGGSWGNTQYNHFGRTKPPYFTTGQYIPSQDWQMWSGVPLE